MLSVKYLLPLVTILTLPALTVLEESTTQLPIDEKLDESPGQVASESNPPPKVIPPKVENGITTDAFTIDSLFLPDSWRNLGEPMNTMVKFTMRFPIYIVGYILGENAETLGLQMLQIGNALLSVGAESFGHGMKDYALSAIAFGKTIKEWFVEGNIPPKVIEELKVHRNYYHWWHHLGESYLLMREEIEKTYSSSF